MPKPRFEWTFNIGHVLIMLGMLVTAFTTYTSLMVTLNIHDVRLKHLETSLPKLEAVRDDIATVRRDIAVIRERLIRVVPDRAQSDSLQNGIERR